MVPRPARRAACARASARTANASGCPNASRHRLLIYQHAKRVHRRGRHGDSHARAGAGVGMGIRTRIATSWRARSICCRPSSSRSSTTTATRSSCARSIPILWRSIGWEDDPNHFVDFGDAGARRVSVRRAAARVRRRARQVRAGHARSHRAAAVARGGGVRQPAARLRGLHPRQRRMRRATSCCSRRWPPTTCRTPTSRFTPRSTTTAS